MSCSRWLTLGACAMASATSAGCTPGALTPPLQWQPSTASLATSFDSSLVCQSLAGQAVGLPMTTRLPWVDAERAPVATAGRWWVRRCSAKAEGPELEIRIDGPGWYWVDQAANGLRVKQQVPFELGLVLVGRLREGIEFGVLSLWFEPTLEPTVELETPSELEVSSDGAWGTFLRWVPGVSPARRAAQRFHDELAQAFGSHLRGGATFTYALASGQPDATLGLLQPGKTPTHPFDEETWSVNDRVLLAPEGTQVVGPIEPGKRQLNVIVERGPGLTYRALCESSFRHHYQAIRSGALAKVPDAAWVTRGTVEGYGERTEPLRVSSCRYFLVISSSKDEYALAGILVRP